MLTLVCFRSLAAPGFRRLRLRTHSYQVGLKGIGSGAVFLTSPLVGEVAAQRRVGGNATGRNHDTHSTLEEPLPPMTPPTAKLALEDGTVYTGRAFGAHVRDGLGDIGRVPVDDGGDHEVQPRSAELLRFLVVVGDAPLRAMMGSG